MSTTDWDVRSALEHEAKHSRDSRSRVQAIKLLSELDAVAGRGEQGVVYLQPIFVDSDTLFVPPYPDDGVKRELRWVPVETADEDV